MIRDRITLKGEGNSSSLSDLVSQPSPFFFLWGFYVLTQKGERVDV